MNPIDGREEYPRMWAKALNTSNEKKKPILWVELPDALKDAMAEYYEVEDNRPRSPRGSHAYSAGPPELSTYNP